MKNHVIKSVAISISNEVTLYRRRHEIFRLMVSFASFPSISLSPSFSLYKFLLGSMKQYPEELFGNVYPHSYDIPQIDWLHIQNLNHPFRHNTNRSIEEISSDCESQFRENTLLVP